MLHGVDWIVSAFFEGEEDAHEYGLRVGAVAAAVAKAFLRSMTAGRIARSARLLSNGMPGCLRKVNISSCNHLASWIPHVVAMS